MKSEMSLRPEVSGERCIVYLPGLHQIYKNHACFNWVGFGARSESEMRFSFMENLSTAKGS